jgi:aerobic-type carbon monoxide dehydrogenase small subunit (CoxS/CutS family)
MITLNVNGRQVSADVDPDMPLLWVLRDHLNLTATARRCHLSRRRYPTRIIQSARQAASFAADRHASTARSTSTT